MKKIINVLLITMLIVSISACNQLKKKTVKVGIQEGKDYLINIVNKFNDSRDIYEVEPVIIKGSDDEYYKQIKEMISNGSNKVDVVTMDITSVAEFADSGYLQSIDDLMKEKGYTQNDFIKEAMISGNYKGKQYTLPFYLDIGLLYYRKDIVKETEAKVLESGNYTYTDLSKLADKYNGEKDTKTGIVFQCDVDNGLMKTAVEFTNSFISLKNGLRILKMMVDAEFSPTDILYYSSTEIRDSFREGKTVFSIDVSDLYNDLINEEIETKLSKEQISIAPLPNGGVIDGYVAGINKNSSNLDGAWEFIRYIASEEGQKIITKEGKHIPGFHELLNDNDVMASNDMLKMDGFKNSMNMVLYRPVTEKYGKVSQDIQLNIHKYLSGIQELDYTTKQIEKLLKDYKITLK